jgi:hypothetical protein
MLQKVMSRAEIGVEDDDLIARRLGERILKIPGFFHVPTVRAQNVVKSELGGQIANVFALTIVENVHIEFAGPLHARDEPVGVSENVEALPIGR